MSQEDPEYPGTFAEVVVAVGHIVKIEPLYYVTGSHGQRFLKKVTKFGEEELLQGAQHVFRVYDSLGGVYLVPPDAPSRKQINDIWMNASH